jgi:Tfp pilus assembly protein PilW
MTISTPPTESRRPRGFTMVEVMIASTLATFVLAGVLSAFLMIGRSGFSAGNYSEMEAQARRGLDQFSGEAREASDIRWNSAQSVTLTVPTSGGSTTVTYGYDAGTFFRQAGAAGSTSPKVPLIRGVSSDFAFRRYRLDAAGSSDMEAANDLETKLLQVTLRARRTGATTVAANQRVYSSRLPLRNKRVTN